MRHHQRPQVEGAAIVKEAATETMPLEVDHDHDPMSSMTCMILSQLFRMMRETIV